MRAGRRSYICCEGTMASGVKQSGSTASSCSLQSFALSLFLVLCGGDRSARQPACSNFDASATRNAAPAVATVPLVLSSMVFKAASARASNGAVERHCTASSAPLLGAYEHAH
eukprot:6991-Heterococcus_DN1.PRE.3